MNQTVAVLVALALIGVGLADMAFGDTNHPVLPAALANHLDQQTDSLVVLAGGGLLWFALSEL